ncbi:MAG TPA: helix-turn-helix domain-containing protein [Sporichthya sp.]|nr:helix-turn-helix domain-containing protein [Sporichthya sp.]
MDLSSSCSIARSLAVLGERWTLLILREASSGTTRFADFKQNLGVASDVLANRLATLVSCGVLSKEPYQEEGARTRYEYLLTPAGAELGVVLGALQQWGDEHLPWPDGPTVVRRDRRNDRPIHVGYVDDRGREVAADNVEWVRTAVYPT